MPGLGRAQRAEGVLLDQVEDRDPPFLLDIGVAPQDRRFVERDMRDARVRHAGGRAFADATCGGKALPTALAVTPRGPQAVDEFTSRARLPDPARTAWRAAWPPNLLPRPAPPTMPADPRAARQYRGRGRVPRRGADRQPGDRGTGHPAAARAFLRAGPRAHLRADPAAARSQGGGHPGDAEALFRGRRGAEGTGRDHLSRAADRRRPGPARPARAGRADL